MMTTNPTNDIQQCIQKCDQLAQRLLTMSEQAMSPQEKMALREGSHHLRLCIEECRYSLQELQSPTMM